MASGAPAQSRSQILALYRSLLRTARSFSDYNVREYTKRRTIDGFRQNSKLSDQIAVSDAFSDGKHQLKVAQRQALVYSLYSPGVKSVMEIQKSSFPST